VTVIGEPEDVLLVIKGIQGQTEAAIAAATGTRLSRPAKTSGHDLGEEGTNLPASE
jgi:hypothetical protein